MSRCLFCVCYALHELEQMKSMSFFSPLTVSDVHVLPKKYDPNLLDGGAVIEVQKCNFWKGYTPHNGNLTDLKFDTQVQLYVPYKKWTG